MSHAPIERSRRSGPRLRRIMALVCLAGVVAIAAGPAPARAAGGEAAVRSQSGEAAVWRESSEAAVRSESGEAAASRASAPDEPGLGPVADAAKETAGELAPLADGAAPPPIPRFSVGWYCPAPSADPLREALGFGVGVLLIWAMAAWRKARDARA